MAEFSDLVGKHIHTIDGLEKGSEKVVFRCLEGNYVMKHTQDCCENVSVEDVIGDVNDIMGWAIPVAEQSVEDGDLKYGSSTWTFYKLDTIKGGITIRWYGSSNGYYSETVDFDEYVGK
jgi:hypothetical protein